MTNPATYAVFLHAQAIETLGAAISPYLIQGPTGPHLLCAEIDAGGALFEMLLIGQDAQGRKVEVELMIPVGMVLMVVSVRRDGDFGFGPREAATEEALAGTPPASSHPDAGQAPGP